MTKSERDLIRVNYPRAVEVAKNVIAMRESKEYPFNQPDLFPDAIIPEHMTIGSKEHALLLFHAVNTDSARSATIVYNTFRKLARKIDLTSLSSLGKKDLKEILIGPFRSFGDPEKARDNPIDILYANVKKLQEEYDGDPRNLIGQNINETLENIQFGIGRNKFIQYGLGKATLLLKNYVRFGVWPFSEFDIPVKIDRHNARIAVGAGVVEIDPNLTRGRTDKLIKILTETYQKVTSQEKISAVDLNDGIWAIGRYKCIKNNAADCQLFCKIGCNLRPGLDERASYFMPRTDTRKEIKQLVLDLK